MNFLDIVFNQILAEIIRKNDFLFKRIEKLLVFDTTKGTKKSFSDASYFHEGLAKIFDSFRNFLLKDVG